MSRRRSPSLFFGLIDFDLFDALTYVFLTGNFDSPSMRFAIGQHARRITRKSIFCAVDHISFLAFAAVERLVVGLERPVPASWSRANVKSPVVVSPSRFVAVVERVRPFSVRGLSVVRVCGCEARGAFAVR